MASIHFTLAALATSAVPNLEVFGVREHAGDPDFASAAIATDRGDLLVRVPRSESAEVRQSAELLGLAALSEGSRTLLPFEIPETLGITRAGETRAVISTLLTGGRFAATDLRDDALLIDTIAESLAAVHGLPTTVAQQGGLPVRTARELRAQAARIMDRAEATRLLPQTVRESWERTLANAELWDFAPSMVHGSFTAERLFVSEDRITGIEGWSELSVGDPALDFAWLLAAGREVLETVISRYSKLHSAGSAPSLRARAAMYRELEVGRWLLHGVESHDRGIIDDAVGMLDRLVDGLVASAPLTDRAALSEEEVEAMLEETPEVVDRLSDTAAYEALDEDRMFGVERAFVDTDDAPDDSRHPSEADVREDRNEQAGTLNGPDGTEAPRDPGEQPTEPIDDSELPR